MVKGKATATVSGRTIAETDEYEVVEGNVYVRGHWMMKQKHRANMKLTNESLQFPPSWVSRSSETHKSLTNTSSVNMSYFSKTDHSTHCPWKGDAAYYSINLDSESALFFALFGIVRWKKQERWPQDDNLETELKNAAWYYPTPKEKASNIKDHVAFCKLFFSWK